MPALRIGIPQALGYYHYCEKWVRFFAELGTIPVLSGPTSREILDSGIELTPAEACLPLKCFIGHVKHLTNRCDLVLVPRLVCMRTKPNVGLGCPKLIGLPDITQAVLPETPLLTADFDERLIPASETYVRMGEKLGYSRRKALHAYSVAIKSGLTRQLSVLEPRSPTRPVIGILGHSYSLEDRIVGLRIVEKIRGLGCTPYSCHQLPDSASVTNDIAPVSWYFEERILGAAVHFLHRSPVDGIVQVLNFGCGAASIVSEIIDYEIRKDSRVPLLRITIDEHTGEAGIETRLESFVDMIRLQREQRR